MGSGGEVNPRSLFFFTEGLVKSFGLYHKVGMSYDEYWHGPFYIIERYNVLLEDSEEDKINDAWLYGVMVHAAIGTALDGKPFPKVSEFIAKDEEEIDLEKEAMVSVALIHQLMGQYSKDNT